MVGRHTWNQGYPSGVARKQSQGFQDDPANLQDAHEDPVVI